MKLSLFFLWIVLLSPAIWAQDDLYSLHGQATTVTQGYPSFDSPYAGTNSLPSGGQGRTSFTTDIFFGFQPIRGTQLVLNPEAAAGSGVGSTLGVAGYPNGEIYRVSDPNLRAYVARALVREIIGLGGDATEHLDSDDDLVAADVPVSRLTVTAGKFSLNDLFDDNAYSHDPRGQFLNWALMDNGAWDYAADTRGYTWGVALEWHEKLFALRYAVALVPKSANGMDLETDISKGLSHNLEGEYRYSLNQHPGVVRLMSYLNFAEMGSYSEAIAHPGVNGPDVTATRAYRNKYGFGLNVQQEVTQDLGAFLRAGWNNGTTETWAFTEIDRTLTGGVSLKGNSWKRPDDTVGLAFVLNGLSSDHEHYLAEGGYGFLLGDGKLNYSLEKIVETYYSFQAAKFLWLSADFQEVLDPAYNADRGPVSIFGFRLHAAL